MLVTRAVVNRSSPLVARLLALVIVPLLAVGYLAQERIATERAAASEASQVVEVVELQQAVAAIFPPAQLERLALSGLAAIDALGVPRDMVVGLTGFDLESIRTDNLADLERAFDALTDRYRTLELLDGSLVGDRLGPIRGALDVQRVLSDEGRAETDGVEAVFEQLDQLLAEILSLHSSLGDDAGLLGRSRFQLGALADVLVSAGHQAQWVIDGTISADADAMAMVRVAAAHDTHVDEYRELLNAQDRAVFDRVTAEWGPADGSVPSSDEAPTSISDPSTVNAAAERVYGQIEYLAALEGYSNGFHERVTADVRAAADRAESTAARTQVLLWAIAGSTLALIALVLWSILVPLRRLTRRAQEINAGEVALPALGFSGPPELRALTHTMNDLVSTLDRVNERIRGLASGEIGLEDPDAVLPGAIGDSLQHSFLHLVDVTGQLLRSEALSSAIVAQADDAIWTTDDAGVVLTANEASHRLTGLTTDEQLGRQIGELLSQSDGEAVVLTRSGVRPKVLVARSAVDIGDDRVIAVIAHDISQRSQFEERLSYQALHDALTGLPNRFAVLEHLDEIRAERPGQVAVLYLDLDGFKSVNDVRGHAVGDRVLSDVAARLRGAVRNGEFIGRLGGDEFIVVTHRFAQTADVVALGHRLIREVELPIDDDGTFFSLSACVGVAIPAAEAGALDMIGQADTAVYQAKRRGHGSVEFFDAAMKEQLDRETELELALGQAVQNNELVLHLQPITDVRTDRVASAEALVRWMRPGHGLVPPNDFIPIAERSGLILEIERWVLTQACERLVAWKERDPSCSRRIAVNISGRHLSDGDLLADVDAILGMTGADPTMLELELTETKLLEDLDRAKMVLGELRSRGITIAIDDFGTGYSSMTYLRELPIDCIKIDRSFVSMATEHGYDSTIVEALLMIGRTLNVSVVAEGVETEDQLDYVRARGCQYAQGFLLARPMSIDAAETYIFASAEDSSAAGELTH